MTATVEQPRSAPQIPIGPERAEPETPLGTAAGLIVCGWLTAADRSTDPYYVWTFLAAASALALLLRPIRSGGPLRRTWLAALQILAAIFVLVTGDRAFAAWEEHAPRFAAASTVASGLLNLVGYHAAAERGLLLIDHPEGLVTMVPSIEKLALGPFLLFWLAWVALRLMRGRRRIDRVLDSSDWPRPCSSRSRDTSCFWPCTSSTTTSSRLVRVKLRSTCSHRLGSHASSFSWRGLASSAPAGRLPDTRRARDLPRLSARTVLGIGGGDRHSFRRDGLRMVCSCHAGKEKAGRILIDDRFCGIWEPTARQLDTEWYGDFPTYSFTSLAEWLGKWYSVDANTTRPYDDELLSRLRRADHQDA